jgi:hypothetical protein
METAHFQLEVEESAPGSGLDVGGIGHFPNALEGISHSLPILHLVLVFELVPRIACFACLGDTA